MPAPDTETTTVASVATPPALDFLVRKSNLRECRVAPAPDPASLTLRPGQVLLAIDTFAFTSNNVTYAALGDMMRYWSFFPAPDGWGRIPVWGFADVVRSHHDDMKPGERVFGYLPMSTHLLIDADRVTQASLMDAAPHRAPMPPFYSQYTRVLADTGYSASAEAEHALLRPLFMTAFLLDDFLAESNLFGARSVILSSASSKTALGLAFLLHKHHARCEVVGLTSPGNAAFVERVGYYDRVISYSDIDSLATDTPAVFVDMAGNAKAVMDLHKHMRDSLKHSCIVGMTHWDQGGAQPDLPGPKPSLFFAPEQARKRHADWGPEGLEARLSDAWRSFLTSVKDWLRISVGCGPAAVQSVYLDMLTGKSKPDEGHMLSLRP